LTTEHQEALDKAANSIVIYVDNVFIIKGIYDNIYREDKEGIASPYLNFRDALFHYKIMHEGANSGDNTVVLQQIACIDEHLNRGIKDFAINLCSNCFVPIIHEMMSSNSQSVSDTVFQRLRHIYHELKNIVAEIRLGGQSLLRFDNNKVHWLSRIIDAIKSSYVLDSDFLQICPGFGILLLSQRYSKFLFNKMPHNAIFT